MKALREENALKSDLKMSQICPIWGQFKPPWAQIYHPCTHLTLKQNIPEVLYSYLDLLSKS